MMGEPNLHLYNTFGGGGRRTTTTTTSAPATTTTTEFVPEFDIYQENPDPPHPENPAGLPYPTPVPGLQRPHDHVDEVQLIEGPNVVDTAATHMEQEDEASDSAPALAPLAQPASPVQPAPVIHKEGELRLVDGRQENEVISMSRSREFLWAQTC